MTIITPDESHFQARLQMLSDHNSQAYLFPNEKSDKLIVVIEGGGWHSVLGIKQNNFWPGVGISGSSAHQISPRTIYQSSPSNKRDLV